MSQATRYRDDPIYREQQKARSARNAAANRERKKAYDAARYGADPEKFKQAARQRNKLARSYGLTVEEIDARWEQQGRACALCRREVPFVIDHDHDSGRVRMLLCYRCNVGLGFFGENPARLREAADYIERFK